MPTFRKKPVEIEAVKVRDLLAQSRSEWPEWVREAWQGGVLRLRPTKDEVKICTLEGNMVGNADDWIIRGVSGELYPCKPDIFAATYDPV